jgi:hypothetical protein
MAHHHRAAKLQREEDIDSVIDDSDDSSDDDSDDSSDDSSDDDSSTATKKRRVKRIRTQLKAAEEDLELKLWESRRNKQDFRRP